MTNKILISHTIKKLKEIIEFVIKIIELNHNLIILIEILN